MWVLVTRAVLILVFCGRSHRYPDFEAVSSPLNDFAFRSYALARDMLDLPNLVPAGQEPVNLVNYLPGHE